MEKHIQEAYQLLYDTQTIDEIMATLQSMIDDEIDREHQIVTEG